MKLLQCILFAFPLVLISCIRQQFTAPENNNADPGVYVYKSIAQFLDMANTAGAAEVKEQIVISGVVIANDKHGSLYKQIVIDDGTAAIPVLLDAYNLYSRFPVGLKIYVRCKGLYTGVYYRLPQLGFTADGRGSLSALPFHLWDQYIVKANAGHTISPVEVHLADVRKPKPELYSRLVTVADIQLTDTNVKSYALPAQQASATNIMLMDCDSNRILLRTSGYSSFQSCTPPKGMGKLTVLYSVYNNTPQLILLDTSDAQMKGQRCL